MSVRLRDIKGLMIKRECPLLHEHNNYNRDDCAICHEILGHDEAIREQGSKEISINREKLAKVIFHSHYPNLDVSYYSNKFEIDMCFRISDAIISNLPELLEAK